MCHQYISWSLWEGGEDRWKTRFPILEFCPLPCSPDTTSHATTTSPQSLETKWCPGPYLHSVNSNIVETSSVPLPAVRCLKSNGSSLTHSKTRHKSLEAKDRVPLAASCQITGYSLLSEGQELGSFVYSFRFCLLHHAAANYIIKTSKVK